MAQASVALPDPLSAAPVSSGNTDDLLAQLAGEEIERLLAEADEPAPNAFEPPALKSAAPPASSATAAPISSLLEAPSRSPSPVVTPPAEKEDVELNALFTQLENSTPAVPVTQTSAPNPPLAPEPSAADALAQEMLEDAFVSGRSALASDAAPPSSFENDEHADTSPLPIRLLEWVNRPLESCSDQARDLIGKIAILTTVNAAAVLAYVILFRGH